MATYLFVLAMFAAAAGQPVAACVTSLVAVYLSTRQKTN
jgi:hypothetical protein